MKTTERVGGPSIAIGLAYLTVKILTPELDWLTEDDQAEAIAMIGILYTHFIFEFRAFVLWLIKRNQSD